MAAGGLDSLAVQVEFVTGSWTTVSSYVRFDQQISASFGRSSQFDDTSAASLTLALRNEDGRFTPDNPTSPYYPNVVEGKRLKVTGTRSGTTYPLFYGTVVAWEPQFPGGDSTSRAVVSVTVVDVLAQLDAQVLGPTFSEELVAIAASSGYGVDVYSFGDETNAVHLLNDGRVGIFGPDLGTATVIPSVTGRGGYSVQQSDDAPFDLSGYMTFSPSGTAGPVLRVVPQALDPTPATGSWDVDFRVRFPTTTIPAPGIPQRVADLWRTADQRLCSLQLVNNSGSVDLELTDTVGSAVFTLATGVNDNVWREIGIFCTDSSGQLLNVFKESISFRYEALLDIAQVVYGSDYASPLYRIYFGGSCYPNVEGKNAACTAMDLTGLHISAYDTPLGVPYNFGDGSDPTTPMSALIRFYGLAQLAVLYLTTFSVVGSDDRNVIWTNITGRTLLECMQELVRTTGGALFATPDGTLTLYQPDAVHSVTPAASIDLEQDIDIASGAPQWQRAAESIPTRAKVNTPAGSVTVVNAAAESSLDGSPTAHRQAEISSCAATLADAASLGWAVLTASPALRAASLTVDLVTAKNNLWSLLTLGVLRPGVRLRLTGLPTATFGYSYADVAVQGWSFNIGVDHFAITFDTIPADTPSRGVVGNSEYGRVSGGGYLTVTGGTARATTSTGTLIITTASGGVPLTTASAAYPMDLNVAGERVTITSAPASSVSPQTVTVTARGVAPTVARAHASGDPVDIWHAAAAAL